MCNPYRFNVAMKRSRITRKSNNVRIGIDRTNEGMLMKRLRLSNRPFEDKTKNIPEINRSLMFFDL
jgi:hypothetical protein